jgi:hypothetical protein
MTWSEQQLAEIVRIVQPGENEDAITRAMIVSGIRRLIEADEERYLELMRRGSDDHVDLLSAPCIHEWYQGACVHCEMPASEYRAMLKVAARVSPSVASVDSPKGAAEHVSATPMRQDDESESDFCECDSPGADDEELAFVCKACGKTIG